MAAERELGRQMQRNGGDSRPSRRARDKKGPRARRYPALDPRDQIVALLLEHDRALDIASLFAHNDIGPCRWVSVELEDPLGGCARQSLDDGKSCGLVSSDDGNRWIHTVTFRVLSSRACGA